VAGLFEGLGDFLLSDGGVEVAEVVAGALDGDLDSLNLLDEGLALLAELCQVLLGVGTLGGDGLDGLLGGRGGHVAREEEVAGESGADVHDIADDADGFDGLGEQQLDVLGHGSLSFGARPS
jgi:hypothetical protein